MNGFLKKWFHPPADTSGTYVVLRKELLGSAAKTDKGQSRLWVSQATLRIAPFSMIPIFLFLNALAYLCVYMSLHNGAIAAFNPTGAPFLLAMCVCAIFISVLTGAAAFAIATFYINPLNALSFQAALPSLLKISHDGIRMLNNATPVDRVFIPFENIESVELRTLLYQGREETEVLKIGLSRAPVNENWMTNWSVFAYSMLRNPVAYLDAKTLKMPPSQIDTVWLPLQILGSDRDFKLLISSLRENVDTEAFPENFFESVSTDYTDSFTSMWFNELRSNSSGPRLLKEGTLIKSGAYEIIGNYGSGGFSVVYKAWHHDGITDSPQAVAIKEFLANSSAGQVSQDQCLRQILSEVTTLSALDHPGIVKLSDHFAEKGRVYLVLEAIHGVDLRQYVSQHHPLPQSEVVALCMQMCKIISYLHSLSPPVFHRDLSPDNFMLADDQIKLIDFNVASSEESAQSTVGKHCYMAAEQFRGEHSFTSDLYQFGATMHFLCTGKDPEPLSPSDPSTLRNDLSKEFCALVSNLTAYDEAQRPASADLVCAELEKISGVPAL